MKLQRFEVESYMTLHENNCRYNLADTVAKSLTLKELLAYDKKDSLEDLMNLSLDYGAIEGSHELKKGILSLYQSGDDEEIAICHGGVNANELVLMTLLSTNDHILSFLPTYQQLYSFPESLGVEVDFIHLKEENEWKIDFEELEKNKQYISSPFNSINTMNLWIAYKKYFCKEGEVDEEMKINNVQEECFKILQDNKTIQTDEQYYFLAGQIAFYLLTQSKASKLTQDMTAPFVKAGNLKKLKDELRCLYEKYNYELYLQDDRFNNIFSQLLLQEPDTSVKDNKDLILAGMLSSNMFYTKKEDK